ncbi:FAD-binding oxidoreductase [Saccharomonospora azurea]|uniref:FAD/FMN-dependent dehydrogenase n=1 Tax=Saccharomonospora azurea NA-128 TaxID=882081 RepID=H8GC10_9PSEU|nr:FAD-binding oxidoreductase [Saccharomonospora azurea]EHY90779.1 FAD/FMN-dependent dehydrogenase [Saccharomonospora azurea NA-128]
MSTTSRALDGRTVRGLDAALAGTALTPEDPSYEDVRAVFNAMVTARPAVIARCATPDDIATALAFATDHDLEVAVRAGGHSVSGASLVDGGLVVDLRPMRDVGVDTGRRTVTVGGGATWADLDAAIQPYHLATTGGRVSTTGVAGLTLGGGSGWLERRFGLSCDNLLAVELVTADGRQVHVDEESTPELFWALHGGGGNFGVATSLTFALHPLPEFCIALLVWPAEQGRAVSRLYRDLLDGAPEAVGGGVIYHTAKADDPVPPELVDTLCCAVLVTYTGPIGELREFIAPLRAAEPWGEFVSEVPYAEFQRMLDDPPGQRNYWSDENLRELPDEALDRFCARAGEMPVPSASQQLLFPWGGAISRGRAWPGFDRGAAWAVHPFGIYPDPADDARVRAWSRGLCADVRPWGTGDAYLNFIGDEGHDRVVAGFGERNYRRLAELKGRYDPDDVFHRWHDIRPLTTA